MKKKGLVFLTAGFGLVLMCQLGTTNAEPVSQASVGQSSDANILAERQFAEAVTLLKQENFSEAIAAYEKVIKLLPESSIAQDARYWIGQTYFRMEKNDGALVGCKKLRQDHLGGSIVPVTRLILSRVEQEKETAKLGTRGDDAQNLTLITDPMTGASYSKVGELTGKKAVIEISRDHLSRSPNGKFLLYDNLVIPLDENEPFKLVESSDGGFSISQNGEKGAY